jgi:disulfide bond formation protein DsbB
MSRRFWGLAAAFAAAAALGVAQGSEKWGGLVPCALCLVERWPYRVAVALGLFAAFLPRRPAKIMFALLTVTMLAGAAAAGVHVGVEQGWWRSPLQECAAPVITGATIAERLAQMPAAPSKPCDDPTYLIPGLPLSMAGMNLIYALALTGFAAWRTRS